MAFLGGLLLDLGACWDKGLDLDLDQGLTINTLIHLIGKFYSCMPAIYVSNISLNLHITLLTLMDTASTMACSAICWVMTVLHTAVLDRAGAQESQGGTSLMIMM